MVFITLGCVSLEIHRFLGVPRWRQRLQTGMRWRQLLGILVSFLPLIILLMLPQIVLWSSGRVFSYLILFKSMLDITIGLTLCAVLGFINGITRTLALWRQLCWRIAPAAALNLHDI